MDSNMEHKGENNIYEKHQDPVSLCDIPFDLPLEKDSESEKVQKGNQTDNSI